jgi:hypothetical protein
LNRKLRDIAADVAPLSLAPAALKLVNDAGRSTRIPDDDTRPQLA